MEHTSAPDHKLRERYVELAEHIQEPYLSPERKRSISIEMGRISFEMEQRQADLMAEATTS